MVDRLGVQSIFISAEDEVNMERKNVDFQTQPMNDPVLNSDNDSQSEHMEVDLGENGGFPDRYRSTL